MPDAPDLPRWYHGPLGSQPRAESKEIHPQMSPKTAAEWAAWQKAEAEKPKEEEKKP
jgi:hypothetical protein